MNIFQVLKVRDLVLIWGNVCKVVSLGSVDLANLRHSFSEERLTGEHFVANAKIKPIKINYTGVIYYSLFLPLYGIIKGFVRSLCSELYILALQNEIQEWVKRGPWKHPRAYEKKERKKKLTNFWIHKSGRLFKFKALLFLRGVFSAAQFFGAKVMTRWRDWIWTDWWLKRCRHSFGVQFFKKLSTKVVYHQSDRSSTNTTCQWRVTELVHQRNIGHTRRDTCIDYKHGTHI